MLKADDILTICNIECWNSCRENREMLDEAEAAGRVRHVKWRGDGRDIRSVIVSRDQILLSPISSTTLQQRANILARANEPRRRLP